MNIAEAKARKCDFFQKMVIREPSMQEVEVAVKGMLQYIEEKKR